MTTLFLRRIVQFIDFDIITKIVLNIYPSDCFTKNTLKFVTAFILNIVLVKYILLTIQFDHVLNYLKTIK